MRSSTPTRQKSSIDNSIIRNIVRQAAVYYKPLSFSFDAHIAGRNYKLQSSSATIIHAPATKASIMPSTTKYIVNIRAINYHLDEAGNIIKNDPHPDIITLNKLAYLDAQFNILSETWVPMSPPLRPTVPYNGVEDVRLYAVPETDIIHYTGSYYNENDKKIGIVIGELSDITAPRYLPTLISPTFHTTNTWEKNWVMFGEPVRIIYKWNPLQICKIEEDKLVLVSSQPMPPIFDKFRGSTNGVNYKGRWWFIVHFHHISAIDNKRTYLHCWVVFNFDMQLMGYSRPFNFRNKAVEYCIGMIENNANFILTYSILDKTTELAIIPIKTIATAIFGEDLFTNRR